MRWNLISFGFLPLLSFRLRKISLNQYSFETSRCRSEISRVLSSDTEINFEELISNSSFLSPTSQIFETVSDETWSFICNVVIGEKHKKELSMKVQKVLEEEQDSRDGVNPNLPGKTVSLPLKINIDLWTYKAKLAMQAGNFSLASLLYNKSVEFDPTDGRGWGGMAKIHWKRGAHDEAEKAYRNGLYYCPNNAFLLQSLAVMLEKQGRVNEATPLLIRSLKANPNHAASWVALGKIRERAGRLSDARACFTSAVKNDPRSYVALQALGVLESQLGEIERAREYFKKALKVSPESVHTYQAWAVIEQRAGELSVAEKLLRKALAVMPVNTRVRIPLVEILELQGDVKSAREVFFSGEKPAAESGDAGFFQAWALFEIRQFNSGKSGPRALSPSDGELPPSLYIARYVSRLADGEAEIRRLFQRAVSVNKFHSASWTAWAKFEQDLGNIETAKKLLVTGISKFPNSKNIAWFHSSLGSLARQEGDLNTARACFARSLAATPHLKSLPVILEYARMEAEEFFRIPEQQLTTSSSSSSSSLSSSSSSSATSFSRKQSPVDWLNSGKRERVEDCGREARRLYELAVARFPLDKRVWDEYFDFESKLANVNHHHLGDNLEILSKRRHAALNKLS